MRLFFEIKKERKERRMKTAKTTKKFSLSKESLTGFAFIAPAVILLFVFLFVPFIMTLGYSFTNYNILKPDAMKFVGLKNLIKLTKDTVFRKSIINTFVFVLLVVPLQVGLGLGLALLINRKLKGISVFRLAFFAPTVLSLVVVSILWTYIYNPNNGLLNSLLGSVGIGPFKFLNDPKTAMLCIVILSAWQGCGFQMMIFLSGLQDIPVYLYEAAAVDGATPFQQFRSITLPGLKNITTFVSLSIVVSAFQLIIQPMMMTAGGPQNATMTIVYEIYQTGFKYNQMGYGSAMALVFTVIVLVITLLQNKLNSKSNED
jgi:fructooligosaccharide transport system permease protein